jgi:hypothetical protein
VPFKFSRTDYDICHRFSLGSGPLDATHDSDLPTCRQVIRGCYVDLNPLHAGLGSGPNFNLPSFSGDCTQTVSGSLQATGTTSAGQHLTFTITNTEIPGALTINKVCNISCSVIS